MEFINRLCLENCPIDIGYPMIIAGILVILIIVFLASLFRLKLKRIKYNIGYYIIRDIIIAIILFIIFIIFLVLWRNMTVY